MSKIALFITAPKDFRDEEYFAPKDILEKAGVRVVTASTAHGLLTGVKGGKTSSDAALQGLKASDYDAVVYVGGGGSQVFFENSDAKRLAVEAAGAGRVLGAICIAPATLANAGVLKNRKATAFPSVKVMLAAGGAVYTGKDVEMDGNIITANGPEAAVKFAGKLLEALGIS